MSDHQLPHVQQDDVERDGSKPAKPKSPTESVKSKKSEAKSVVTFKTKSSSGSRRSVALIAQRAALQAEAAALERKEEIERQMLQLEQKAKRLEIETQMKKLEAEQNVLDNQSESTESRGSVVSEQSSHAKSRKERTAAWVHNMKPEEASNQGENHDPEVQARQGVHTLESGGQLDPHADEFRPGVAHRDPHASDGARLEDMIQTLHMPKVEMMTFEGDPIRYWTFIKAFENSVGRQNIDEHAKLARLLQYCKGKAYKVIESCAAMHTGGYARAKQLLHERFGDKYTITTSWLNKVTSGAKIGNDTLQDYADELLNLRETLRALDCLGEINQQVLVRIAEKLPTYMQHRWRRQVSKLRENHRTPGIDDLVSFVRSAAKEINDPVYGNLGSTSKSAVSQPQAKKGFHGATTMSPETVDQKSCVACSSDCQTLFKCDKFKQLKPNQRFDLAKEKRLCFNCLKNGHSSAKCRIERSCDVKGCTMKHTKLLHVPRSQGQKETSKKEAHTEGEADSKASAVSMCSGSRDCKVALPVVRVRVAGNCGSSVLTCALLDSGSTNTFCSTSLLQRLKSDGKKTAINLTTLRNQDKLETSVHELEVSDAEGRNKVTIPRVYATASIPVADDIVRLDDVERWDHLRDLPILKLQEQNVEMLIGQDCPDILMPLEVRTGESSGGRPAPFATRTLFGWTVNGPVGEDRESTAFVNFVSSSLEQQVEAFWKIEGAQISSGSKGLSAEDQKALEVMEKTVKIDDGHYSVGIPFRGERGLPNNRALAEKRLAGLAKKLQNNPKLKEEYQKSMAKLIELGHAERVSDNEPVINGAEWYVPHHAVVSPTKSKIRVVFDCAAKYADVALNEQVLQGPDMTNGLLGILLRFRQQPVAISADVEAMFLQVKVPEGDRNVLRFLWWPGGDTDAKPEVYRMASHLFGGTWSPSVCSFALRQTAKDNAEDFSPEVVTAVLQDFYVDDFLKSVKTEAEALQIVTELPKLLKRGGFRLCKWISNRTEVLEAIPETEKAKGLQDLNRQALPAERSLGVLWDVESDTFTFNTKDAGRPLTRRGMLGAVSSVYDPMGFVTPFTIRGRKLVQDLVRKKTGWDDPLDEETMKKWKEWLAELENINLVQIDRCVRPSTFGDTCKSELHHFADASSYAYGAVSYLRQVNERGEVKSDLLFSRSRVAPLKGLTIPRLELAAAALAIQQDEMLRRELSVELEESYFWTDSSIVLAYIRNQRKRFHTFVANRLSIIHAGSSAGQWKHVTSKLNPADDLSRGLSMQVLAQRQRWFHGPQFLYQLTVTQESEPSVVALDDDPEVKRDVKTCMSETSKDVTAEFISRYSTWTGLKRAVAWLLRYKEYLLAKARKQTLPRSDGKLNVQELKRAEICIIRFVQGKEYSEEMRRLQSLNKAVSKNSRIYKLDPTLTKDGVLVCRVRNIKMFASPDDAPAILPKNHHVSALLARHFHEFYGHAGREFTGAKVRQRYWIQGLRSIVRQTLSECRECRRLFSKPMNQRMADLPKERLAKDKPPFTNVGVDCFGPFVVKAGRKQLKRYGCIFTCLTSRAIHSMDTDSFINALHRFMSRRGNPETISCDNGTNFVGAERELRASIQQWNQQRLDSFLSQRDVQWRFNPPAASHMGGAWERLIRTVRRTLQSVMTEQVTSDETLNTLMCIVENIVNSRPLTVVSDDPTDLGPLTPNHLLLLKPTTLPSPGIFVPQDCYVRRRWRQVQYLADIFWRRWIREYLPLIQLRTKWRERRSNLKIGDIVLIVDNNAARNEWQLGRVVEVFPGKDGLIRSAKIRTASTTLMRPVAKLCFLEGHSNTSDDKQKNK